MITHIYIDTYKSNATFCTSKNNGNNQCGHLLQSKDIAYFSKFKDDPNIKWCKKCVKNLKSK